MLLPGAANFLGEILHDLLVFAGNFIPVGPARLQGHVQRLQAASAGVRPGNALPKTEPLIQANAYRGRKSKDGSDHTGDLPTRRPLTNDRTSGSGYGRYQGGGAAVTTLVTNSHVLTARERERLSSRRFAYCPRCRASTLRDPSLIQSAWSLPFLFRIASRLAYYVQQTAF